MAGEDDSQMQKFELYIKASAIDKETKGACPICQQFFMITCLLGENQEDIDFKVFTVQADCPPKNFAAGWSKKYPVVMVNSGRNKFGQDISGMMYDTFEELETFFESINKECPELKRKNTPNITALSVVENLYKHFNHFISGQPETGLLSQLRKLNEYLEGQDTKFLVDNVLSFADCHLLPRLQHIRVAGKAYRNFDIPKEFTYIWKYLRSAYEQDAFKSTMPSDQDVVFNYEKKAGGPPVQRGGRGKGKPTLEKFTYLMEVPEDILNGLGNGTSADGGAQAEEEEQSHVPEPQIDIEPAPEKPCEEPDPPTPESVVDELMPSPPEPPAATTEPAENDYENISALELQRTVEEQAGRGEGEENVYNNLTQQQQEAETGEDKVADIVATVLDLAHADSGANGDVKGQVEAS